MSIEEITKQQNEHMNKDRIVQIENYRLKYLCKKMIS